MTALAIYLSKHNHNVYVVKADDREYGDSIAPHSNLERMIKEVRSIEYCSDRMLNSILIRRKMYREAFNEIIKTRKIDMAIMSAEPTEYLPLFKEIKANSPNTFCVMDIRDPLGLDDHYGGNALSLKRKVYILSNVLNEKLASKYVDMITVVTEEAKKYYEKRYPHLKQKIECIKNGYDDVIADISRIDRSIARNDDEIQLGIFGQYYLYGAEYSEYLLRLTKEYSEKKVVIRQFGVHDVELERLFVENNAGDNYIFEKSEGYYKDISKLACCDIGVTAHHSRSSCGTKIYDYMLINRPIIALNSYESNELFNVVRQFENGYACRSYEAFRDAFLDIVTNKKVVLDHDRKKLQSNGREYQFDLLIKKINEKTDVLI